MGAPPRTAVYDDDLNPNPGLDPPSGGRLEPWIPGSVTQSLLVPAALSSFRASLDVLMASKACGGEHVEAAVFRVFIERGFQSAHLEAREHEPRVVVAVAFPRLVVLLGGDDGWRI